MKISPALPQDAGWLDDVIRVEFPYTMFSPEKILLRITDPHYLVLASRQKNIIQGFLELEFFEEEGEVRLNAVYIEDYWRLMRIATNLIKRAIKEAKKRGMKRMFLLVKEKNDNAKRLYQRLGFRFERMHDKLIEGSYVEVWALPLQKEHKRPLRGKGFFLFG